jgi:hypothetical protein
MEVLEEYPGPMPGQLPMHVTTDAAMEWPEAAAQLASRGVFVEVLHTEDAVQNLEDLRRIEAAFQGKELVERRSAWRLMADLDAESVAIRALLPQLAALAPDGDQASDPRLQEVQRIVDAELAFWREVQAPADATRTGPAAGAAAPARSAEPEEVAIQLRGPRLLLGCRRWIVTRTSFARVRSICTEVAAHAKATADKASDPAVAAKYRTLATRCLAATKSIQLAFAP